MPRQNSREGLQTTMRMLWIPALSGTGKRIKVHRIEDAYSVLGMVGSKLYYSAVKDPVGTNNYVYDIETGETTKISFDEYAVNGSYNNFNGRFQ